MSIDRDAASAYVSLLDDVVQDRVITETEVRRLRETANEWGIGALEAEHLHRAYVVWAWERTCASGTPTPEQLQDFMRLAELLGVPTATWLESERHRRRRRVAVPVEPGAHTDESGSAPGSEETPVTPVRAGRPTRGVHRSRHRSTQGQTPT